MTDHYPTCAERISSELGRELSRLDQVLGNCEPELGYWDCTESDDWPDLDEFERLVALRDEYLEGVLDACLVTPDLTRGLDDKLDATYYYHVQLSWGGPGDGFILGLGYDRQVYSAGYYFQDWFDGASWRLPTARAKDLADLWQDLIDCADWDAYQEDLEVYAQERREADED